MEFLTDSKKYNCKIAEIETLISRDIELPNQVFQVSFTTFLCISFEDLFNDFFQMIDSVVKASSETGWTFAVIDPEPEMFFQHFKRYRIFEVTPADSHDDFQAIFWDEPSESLESIAISASIIVVYPKLMNWAIYADRDFEIGIVGLQDNETMETFTSAYGRDRLFTMAEAIPNLLEVIYKDHVVPENIRKELLANYG